jgi:hypothetical protein
MSEWTPGNPNDRSVLGFRIRHGGRKGPMSKSKYHELKKAGRAPKEIADGRWIIITPKAEADWERKMQRPTTALARLMEKEAQVRVKRSRIAAAKRKEA